MENIATSSLFWSCSQPRSRHLRSRHPAKVEVQRVICAPESRHSFSRLAYRPAPYRLPSVAAYGIATPDLSIGPGVAPLRAMLACESIAHDTAPSNAEDMFTRARDATVHVFCWQ